MLFAAALAVAGFWGCNGSKNSSTGTAGTGATGGSGATGGTGGTTGKGGSGGTGGMTTTTSQPPDYSWLGSTCMADSDCPKGGKCILDTDNDPLIGGGAAGGYCTKPCEVATDCGLGNTCLDDGQGHKECFLGCTFGQPPIMYLNDALDETKCHGREDLRCQQLQDGSEICLPTCGSDSQCGARQCDPRLAVCVDMPTKGKALGEKCDPKAMMTDCAGTCIGITGGNAECTSPCVMGGAIDDTTTDCGGLDKGVCIYSPKGTGVGDLAFCTKSCKKQDDCQTPGFFCFNLNIPSNGACLDSVACMSDADCANLPNGGCVNTNIGKYCMSSKYPLGSLEPVASGSSGAGGAGGGMMMSGSSSSGM
jgi:hypothetical protein